MIFIIYTLCVCISVRFQDYYMIRRPKLRGAGQELTTQGRGRGWWGGGGEWLFEISLLQKHFLKHHYTVHVPGTGKVKQFE